MLRLPASILQGILARAALVLLRIYLGVVFLLTAWPKLGGEFVLTLENPHPFYREFAQRVLLPDATVIATVVGWAELLVGVGLVLGLITRFTAGLALILSVNYMLANGAWLWTPWSHDAAFAVISLALLIGAAGRTFGLDAFLARRWPRSPFW
jgi:thiosulfate dehydrogenase [quinone] large subunit